jgi:Tfp pilus assembly protein PilE
MNLPALAIAVIGAAFFLFGFYRADRIDKKSQRVLAKILALVACFLVMGALGTLTTDGKAANKAGEYWVYFVFAGAVIQGIFFRNKDDDDEKKGMALWLQLILLIFGIALIGIVAAIAIPAYQSYTHPDKTPAEQANTKSDEAELNAALIQAAAQANKDVPKMIDSETRLDSVAGVNRQIRYNYTMVNHTIDDMDLVYFRNTMQGKLTELVCTTKEMKVFIINNVPVVFSYADKNGTELSTITVQSAQCTNPPAANTASATINNNPDYSIATPEGWKNDNSLEPDADMAMSNSSMGYYFYSDSVTDGSASLIDASNIKSINIGTKINASNTTACNVTQNGDSFSCEVSVSGCLEATCLSYLITTVKKGDKVIYLVGWSPDTSKEAFNPAYHQIVDTFKWANQ